MFCTKCVFSGRSENQDDHPGLCLAETFSKSPLLKLNGFDEIWQEALTQRVPRLYFSGR